MKKENALRKLFKDLLFNDDEVHLTWVESHATAIGAPDIQYCCGSVEGWLELKAGPDLDVRASQVQWMKSHIAAGGYPLFIIQWSSMFLVVPGSRAKSLRANPSWESVQELASYICLCPPKKEELKQIMKNPDREFILTPSGRCGIM